jgi:hypothetical protein
MTTSQAVLAFDALLDNDLDAETRAQLETWRRVNPETGQTQYALRAIMLGALRTDTPQTRSFAIRYVQAFDQMRMVMQDIASGREKLRPIIAPLADFFPDLLESSPTQCNGNLLWPRPNGDGRCTVHEGEMHVYGCPYERCGRCGGQYLYCPCADALDDADRATENDPRQRVPFVLWPNLCGRCGGVNPDFFDVPTDVWEHYTDGGAYAEKHGQAVMFGTPEHAQRMKQKHSRMKLKQRRHVSRPEPNRKL